MNIIYKFIEFILPIECMEYDFMKNALLSILIVSPLFGILGTMVINNKMSFFSDALGHSALTGIALGVVFGINNPLLSMVGFAIVISILIMNVKKTNNASVDTIIGVFSSASVALGIVILSYNGGFSKYSNYMIGDILSIGKEDLIFLLILGIVIMAIWLFSFNKLLLVSINNTLAKSRGVNVDFYEYMFTILIAIVVTVSIQWIGVLVISSMMILPAASSRNISKNVRQYHFYSIVFSLISGILGLFVSYQLGSATGATIILISSVFFAITFFISIIKSN